MKYNARKAIQTWKFYFLNTILNILSVKNDEKLMMTLFSWMQNIKAFEANEWIVKENSNALQNISHFQLNFSAALNYIYAWICKIYIKKQKIDLILSKQINKI